MNLNNLSYSDILKIGDERLYQKCTPITVGDRGLLPIWIETLHRILMEVKAELGFGRGIAAPQLGIMKRLVYIYIDQPLVLVNPKITSTSSETVEIWDDCMSIPNMLIKVPRHRQIDLTYMDDQLHPQTMTVTDLGLSELIQHEVDHLDGILSTMRAIDHQSMRYYLQTGSTGTKS